MRVTIERTKQAESLPLPGYSLEWRDLTYSVSKEEPKNYDFLSLCRKDSGKLEILKNASGHIQSGDLVAVLGCSGAGKTTLLAAISQRLRGDIGGYVTVNNTKVDRQEMAEISGFLPQFEIQSQSLTAYEHLYFMAHLKMDRRISRAEKNRRVSSILFLIGIRDKANTRISHMSGGERKRLSLAEELLKDPPFIFCDEPTTGLDSYSAFSVIQALHQLCSRDSEIGSSEVKDCEIPISNYQTVFNSSSKNKAIICSIHQPTSDVFEIFTHIILVDAGRIIYQGSSADALLFFSKMNMGCPKNTNPSDHFIKMMASKNNDVKNSEVIAKNFELEQSSMWQSRTGEERNESLTLKSIKIKRPLWMNQVYYLLRLTFLENMRNIKTSLYETSFYLLTAFFIVATYALVPGINQTTITDISGSLFMVPNETIFPFFYSATYFLPSNLPRIRREIGERTYCLSAYMTALSVSFLPSSFMKAFMIVSMFYLTVSYVQGLIMFLKMFLVTWMAAIMATSYGLFVSSIFESSFLATEMANPLHFLFIAFSGAYLNVDYIAFLKYLSPLYYTNEAMMNLYWRNVTDIDCSTDVDGTDILPCIRNGIQVLQLRNLSPSEGTFVINLVCLMIITLIFTGFAYLFIRRFIRRSGYY